MKAALDYFSNMTAREAWTYALAITCAVGAVLHFCRQRKHAKAAWWDHRFNFRKAKDREDDTGWNN